MGDFFASAKSITEYCSIIVIICLMFDSFVYIIRVGLWFFVCVLECACLRARTTLLIVYVCMYHVCMLC
jgi:hypothetical protein